MSRLKKNAEDTAEGIEKKRKQQDDEVRRAKNPKRGKNLFGQKITRVYIHQHRAPRGKGSSCCLARAKILRQFFSFFSGTRAKKRGSLLEKPRSNSVRRGGRRRRRRRIFFFCCLSRVVGYEPPLLPLGKPAEDRRNGKGRPNLSPSTLFPLSQRKEEREERLG